MTDLRTAAQQALEALHSVEWHGGSSAWMLDDCKVDDAIKVLRAALVEDAMQKFTDVNQELEAALADPLTLTDEVIADLWHQNGGFHHHFARAIERWLKGNP